MNMENNGWREKFAGIISVLLHPVFMPVYGLLLIYSAPTLFSYLPFHTKKLVLIVVVLNNVLLPLSITAILYAQGFIKTVNARERNERIILLVISFIFYCITAILFFKLPVPAIIKALIMSTAIVVLISLFITLSFRISLHSVGVGGLLALKVFLVVLFNAVSIGYLAGLIIIAGLVMTSRMRLEEHSSSEVWAGLFTGFTVMILSLVFLL